MSRCPQPTQHAKLDPIPRHYSTAEAARLIGMSSGHLRNLRADNRGPRWIVTTDKRVLYPTSSLAEYLGIVEVSA